MSSAVRSTGRDVMTRDLEESRSLLHRAGLCPHRVEILENPQGFAVRHRAVPIGTVVLSQLVYDTAVRVTHRHADDSYVVHIPLVGDAPSTVGGRRVLATPAAAAVIGPGDTVSMRWQAHSPHLMVRLDGQQLHDTLRRQMGQEGGPLRLQPVLDLSSSRGRSWLELVALLKLDVDNGARLSTHELARHHVQQLVMIGFLLTTGNAYTAEVHDEPRVAAAAPTVRRARDLIHAHAAEPLTVADVAEAVGVGVRSLQHSFRRQLGTTPTTYLRQVRLTRVRAELAAAGPTDRVRVTDVALRWGFVHPGRFSQVYRATYGEPPLATLAREPGQPAARTSSPGTG